MRTQDIIKYRNYGKLRKPACLNNLIIGLSAFSIIIINSPKHLFFYTHIFYLSLVLISSILASVSDLCSKKESKLCCLFLSITIIAFPFVSRDMMGTDDPVYLKIFKAVMTQGFLNRFLETTMEPGYLFINYVSSIISNDYILCQIICASIPFAVFFIALYKGQKQIYYYFAILYISTFLYFHVLEAALVRIFIAISIVFYGYRYLVSGDTKKYLITILIAMTIHYSAGIMFLFAIFTIKEKFYARHPFKITIVLILLSVVGVFFISFFAMYVLGPRYAGYILDESEMGTFSIFSFDTLPFFMFGLWFSRNIPKYERSTYNIFLIILLFSSVISCITILIPIGRIIFYFNLSLIYLLSYWYKYSSKSLRWCIALTFTFYCLLYVEVTKLSDPANNLFPYKGIFFIVQ